MAPVRRTGAQLDGQGQGQPGAETRAESRGALRAPSSCSFVCGSLKSRQNLQGNSSLTHPDRSPNVGKKDPDAGPRHFSLTSGNVSRAEKFATKANLERNDLEV
ncbi:hypothetical protein DUI87_04404 [Hirundo rustica rustica]|uniref:Uncharacterized protein n=1 Tax=Hirundo rustica rustica TaxID=333673 RepID=A0A3M0KZE3_HIRRU|nr:hypothetical protein DUI87_04404 [Hirundo rustica rustica]